jgi:hypothetical protein
MPKLDLKQTTYKTFYTASRTQPNHVELPPLSYLTITGSGHPDTQDYQDAITALYTLAYTLKFMVREQNPELDYGVMPLETQWFVDRQHKGQFNWTLLMLQPEWITPELFSQGQAKARAKQNPLALDRLHHETLTEGLCAQILHVGPYEGMNQTLARMTQILNSQGYQTVGDTHDIYLNNKLKTRPENLKAIQRIRITKAQ